MPDAVLLEKARAMKEDLYALLSVPSSSSADQIKRAYRRTALKYHPDKNADDPVAVSKFHTLTDALAILTDDDARKTYDSLRAAEQKRREAIEAMDSQRRQMVDHLERREREYQEERAGKRKLDEKLERMAVDGRRRLEEMRQRRRREAAAAEEEERQRRREQEQERGVKEGPAPATAPIPTPAPATEAATKISDPAAPSGGAPDEVGRSVRVRWALEGAGSTVTRDAVEAAFSKYGKIEIVVMPDRTGKKARKARLRPGWKHRKPVAEAFVVFRSVEGADRAVGSGGDDVFQEVKWVSEPGGDDDDDDDNGRGATKDEDSGPSVERRDQSKPTRTNATTVETASVGESNGAGPLNPTGPVPSFRSFLGPTEGASTAEISAETLTDEG